MATDCFLRSVDDDRDLAPGCARDSDEPVEHRLYRHACDVMCDLSGANQDWFSFPSEGSYADVQNNYGTHGRQRRRTRFEQNGIRFDVHLWARVDWHSKIQSGIADELRRMAEFLNEQADEVEGRLAAQIEVHASGSEL